MQRNKQNEEGQLINILIVGDKGVGKSSLISSFLDLDKEIPPTDKAGLTPYQGEKNGVVYTISEFHIGKYGANINKGSKPFDAIFFVCDVNQSLSINNLKNWKENCDFLGYSAPIRIVLANKTDKEHSQKSVEAAKSVANKLNFAFREVSALQGVGVRQTFEAIQISKLQVAFKKGILEAAKAKIDDPSLNKSGRKLFPKKPPENVVQIRGILENLNSIDETTRNGRRELNIMFNEYVGAITKAQIKSKGRRKKTTALYQGLFQKLNENKPEQKTNESILYKQARAFINNNNPLPTELMEIVLMSVARDLKIPDKKAQDIIGNAYQKSMEEGAKTEGKFRK